MDPVMQALSDKVTAIQGAAASAVVLIKAFASYVAAHKTDPVALQAYADKLGAAATDLGDAVAANPDPNVPVP
jgi:hypothetical protein